MGNARRTGAGEGNRTLVLSLEGFCSTIELHPLDTQNRCHVRLEGVGFEPTKAEPADLQSAPVDRLGTPPQEAALCTNLGRMSTP